MRECLTRCFPLFFFCYVPPFEGGRATCFFPVQGRSTKGTIFFLFISKRRRRETKWHCRTDLVLYTLRGNKGRKKEASVHVAISPHAHTWIVCVCECGMCIRKSRPSGDDSLISRRGRARLLRPFYFAVPSAPPNLAAFGLSNVT